jgi:hypothetical protein
MPFCLSLSLSHSLSLDIFSLSHSRLYFNHMSPFTVLLFSFFLTQFICLSLCLPSFLSVCLSIFRLSVSSLPFCLSVCLSPCLCVCMSLCLLVRLSVSLSLIPFSLYLFNLFSFPLTFYVSSFFIFVSFFLFSSLCLSFKKVRRLNQN